jgi:hypothetical protein
VERDMKAMRVIANAHLRRDMEAGGKWVCDCGDCHEIRSLIGVEKTLEVRPLVRKIVHIEEQLNTMADGPDRRTLLEHFLKVHDELAEAMSK